MKVKISCGCILAFKYQSWDIDGIDRMCLKHFREYKDNKNYTNYFDFVDETVELK